MKKADGEKGSLRLKNVVLAAGGERYRLKKAEAVKIQQMLETIVEEITDDIMLVSNPIKNRQGKVSHFVHVERDMPKHSHYAA
jgi:hypothetical protein